MTARLERWLERTALGADCVGGITTSQKIAPRNDEGTGLPRLQKNLLLVTTDNLIEEKKNKKKEKKIW